MTKLPTVLLYNRRGNEIDIYEELIKQAHPTMDLRVCRSLAEAEANIAEVEVVFGVHLPAEIYAKATCLQWIQSMWAGVENLLAIPLHPQIIITKPWDVFGRLISQYVFGYILATYIKLREAMAAQALCQWQPYRMETLQGKRLGIAGVGNVGSEVARIGKSFAMETWGLVRSNKAHPFIDHLFTTNHIEEFVSGIDILVITLPATAQTKGLFSREILTRLSSQVLLINVGRGVVMDELVLLDLLRERRIAAAVLDVFQQEPLPTTHPFWQLPNCTVTPHIGAPSFPADITRCFLENYQRFINGEPLLGKVNREYGY